MTPRLFLFAFIAFATFILDARGQIPSGNKPAAAAPTSETKAEINARKKAERIAIRKKRAQCYDEAKKEKLAGQDLIRFLETCNKK